MHIATRLLFVGVWLGLFGMFVVAARAIEQKAARVAEVRKAERPAPKESEENQLGPEDVLEIFVWKEPELTTTVTVRPDGKISVPLINELQASGRTAQQLQQEIVKRLSSFISNPYVTVAVKQYNSFKISVLGEVRKPDVFKLSRKITALDAIALAGGFTEFAKKDRVIIFRDSPSGQLRIPLNLKKYISEGHGELFYLKPGDVVYVE